MSSMIRGVWRLSCRIWDEFLGFGSVDFKFRGSRLSKGLRQKRTRVLLNSLADASLVCKTRAVWSSEKTLTWRFLS